MKAGLLRWPVTIQQKTPVKNSTTGEVTYTWSTFASVWADMQSVSRRGSRAAWEAIIAEQERAQRVIEFMIRYIPGVDETMRILDYDGKVWDIKSILDDDTRHKMLSLVCEFGVSQG